ncbi:hypothetical protein [Stenotrophomonas sp. GZD-301]|uniref:hypothetical protein n=1 Tax=Stenotrophomonas sp. GZD-301 TaxID=3404814 RepID=UPI003BB4C1ED
MNTLVKGTIITQLLAMLTGLVYFAVLTYRRYPDALGAGLRAWGYFALIYLLLHLFLALKLWWENSRGR